MSAPCDHDELWQRLAAFRIGDPDAPLSFSSRLARENGWSHDFAARVVEEYKRFVYLVVRADHPVTPSEQIDQVWHLHLVYTESYWRELCGEVVGQPIHHSPTIGGLAEGDRFVDQYEQTLASYRDHFGEEAPADIWPPSDQRFAPPNARWVDTSRHWLIRKPGFLRRRTISTTPGGGSARGPITAALLLALFLSGCASLGLSVGSLEEILNLRGSPFLLLFLCLIPCTLLLSLLLARVFRGSVSGRSIETLTDPYEIAFLAGGGRRAMDAAIASLYDEHRIKVGSATQHRSKVPGLKRVEGALADDLEGVQRSVFLALPRESAAPIGDLRGALKPVMLRIRDDLRAAGLLLSSGQLFTVHLLAALPFLALIGLGVSKVVVGLGRDKPVLFLIGLLVITFLLMCVRLNFVYRRTPDGQRLWKQLSKQLRPAAKQRMHSRATYSGTFLTEPNEQPRFADGASSAQALAFSVAILGASALRADATLHSLRSALSQPGLNNGSGGGCGTGCGGGGGGGCGGGCGGCGGCGG